jgi:hypothetical protein
VKQNPEDKSMLRQVCKNILHSFRFNPQRTTSEFWNANFVVNVIVLLHIDLKKIKLRAPRDRGNYKVFSFEITLLKCQL